MTDRDRVEFARLMLGLGETYGEPVSQARMEIYFGALSDLELSAVRAAANIHVRTQKFFPRPSDLRESVQGNINDHAELAWNAIRALVRRVGYYNTPKDTDWPDEATKRAALELYGGWGALCSRLPAEGPEMLGAAKLFKATYLAYAGRELRDKALPSASVAGYLHDGND
jgi:hypothetical protein